MKSLLLNQVLIYILYIVFQNTFRLTLHIRDSDPGLDDDIDTVFIRESLNVSLEKSPRAPFTGSRITLELRFRVTCTNGYMGPQCDCFPHDDDTNGHYLCEDDGSITCRPGFVNTSNQCRQGKYV